MDLTGITPGTVCQRGGHIIFLAKAYAGDVSPKTLGLKTDHFRVGELRLDPRMPPLGYVFKPLNKVTSLPSGLIFGPAQNRITLDDVLAARVPVKPLYQYDLWSYFEYSGMVEIVIFKPPQTLIERFDI